MLWRVVPWAIGGFLLFYVLKEPGHVGHFIGWAFWQVLRAFGQLAIAVDSL